MEQSILIENEDVKRGGELVKIDVSNSEPKFNCIDEKICHKLLEDYMKKYIIRNHFESYNWFVTEGIQLIIDDEADLTFKLNKGDIYTLSFGQVTVLPPHKMEHNSNRNIHPLYPQTARRQDLDYDGIVCCDIKETFTFCDKPPHVVNHPRVQIARLPVMVKSSICNLNGKTESECIQLGECIYDYGGYFIAKGIERVLITQIKAANNNIIVYKSKDNYLYTAEMRSMSEETGHSILVKVHLSGDDCHVYIECKLINDNEQIPVGIIFKALGFNDQDIINIIGIDPTNRISKNHLKQIIRDSYCISDNKKNTTELTMKERALLHIGSKLTQNINSEYYISQAEELLNNSLFPHLGITSTPTEIALTLGELVRKLLFTRYKIRLCDNRDSITNKRFFSSGLLLYDIFKPLYKKFLSEISTVIGNKKSDPDIISIISKNNFISKEIKRCITTGNWKVPNNKYVIPGVSQVLNRMTYISTLSHLTRMVNPTGNEAKNKKIRQIDTSHFFFIDPNETPEGKKVGVVLNHTIFAKISTRYSKVIVQNVIDEMINKNLITFVDSLNLVDINNSTIIKINSIIIGITKDVHTLLNELYKLRDTSQISQYVTISYNCIDNEITIYCDEGRMLRPLFTVNNAGVLNITEKLVTDNNYNWDALISKGLIKYIDSSEVEMSVIGMYPSDLNKYRCNYCEITPIGIMGFVGSAIPWPDHSQSPRNVYQCSMGKQALGIPILSYKNRTDTILYVMHSLQKPLVYTKTAEYMNLNEMPSGVNAIVAIMSFTGFNQEDSIIMNQSSIQRGLFYVTGYRTVTVHEKKKDNGEVEPICIPPNTTPDLKEGDEKYFKRKIGNYSLLETVVGAIRRKHDGKIIGYEKDSNGELVDKTGIIRKGATVKVGDVLVGKVFKKRTINDEYKLIDCSVTAKASEEGIVDEIYVEHLESGYKLVKIRIRKEKIPEPGDKFAARSAQKGTIGIVYRQEDMPFSIETGMTPDLIINPHAIPSRMTINQLIECVCGKYGAMEGEFSDCTTFTKDSINIADKISEKLGKVGFQRYGFEQMCNGCTGEMIESRIFIGPTYYQRLKHIVSEKCHSRSKGHLTMITRQPTEGRSRAGGLRFGEMERDCMISHGTSRFLKERLFDVSNPYSINICNDCGNFTTTTVTTCRYCNNNLFVPTNLSFTAKQLFLQINAMNIKTIIHAK